MSLLLYKDREFVKTRTLIVDDEFNDLCDVHFESGSTHFDLYGFIGFGGMSFFNL